MVGGRLGSRCLKFSIYVLERSATYSLRHAKLWRSHCYNRRKKYLNSLMPIWTQDTSQTIILLQVWSFADTLLKHQVYKNQLTFYILRDVVSIKVLDMHLRRKCEQRHGHNCWVGLSKCSSTGLQRSKLCAKVRLPHDLRNSYKDKDLLAYWSDWYFYF